MNQYTVQPGDTLSLIAGRLGISPWQAILQYNPQITDADTINVGDVINYPASAATAAAASSTAASASGDSSDDSGMDPTYYLYGAAAVIVVGALFLFPTKPSKKKGRR